MVAVKEKKLTDAEQLVLIIDMMNENEDFFNGVMSSTNIAETISNNGFVISNSVLTSFDVTIKNIKKNVKRQVDNMTSKLLEVITNYNACNGTGGW